MMDTSDTPADLNCKLNMKTRSPTEKNPQGRHRHGHL
jgi:hypothetical protein